MRKILILSICLVLSIYNVAAQSFQPCEIIPRTVSDNSNGLQIEYTFSAPLHFNTIQHFGTTMQIPSIKGAGFLQQKGKPALPTFTIIVALQGNELPQIEFHPINTFEQQNIFIAPWIGMALDYMGSPEPVFTMDSAFYQSDIQYPHQQAELLNVQRMRGQNLALIRICPFSYNPLRKTLEIYSRFTLRVTYSENSSMQESFMNGTQAGIINNIIANPDFFKQISLENDRDISVAPVYLIITHNDYLPAAEKISQWREQTGYNTQIISRSAWSWEEIRQTVREKYLTGNPRPSYLLLLGDHDKVPGAPFSCDHGIFPTDKPYVFLDGQGDYLAELAVGRISVISPAQAISVVEKIIAYEKFPPSNAAFYETALAAAYFQDDNSDDYADRRFAQTAEEILTYLTNEVNLTVNRAYYTGTSITPLYWNDEYYSAGEPVPAHLLKPGFAWNGSSNTIRTQINAGSFLVYHRDHGYDGGWGDPAYTTANVNALTNGNLLPVVASVNCQTGMFLTAECFAEAFIRKTPGGAAGIFAHAEVSYSGYNDALSMGVIDAIFAQPGLIPAFTGIGHISGTVTPHSQILTLGDVSNQALLRMTQTWGDAWGLEEYQFNIFHLFGDPATRIFTQMPTIITASHDLSIECGDTVFEVLGCTNDDALATLTSDGQLIGMTSLQNGVGTIHFAPTASSNILLTISAPNSAPYIQSISLEGLCVQADYEISQPSVPCYAEPITFSDMSTGYITDLQWLFGPDANPSSAYGSGPHDIIFAQGGMKTIQLVAFSPAGNDTLTDTFFVDTACPYIMDPADNQLIQSCEGTLWDNGYTLPYASGSNSRTVITSPGATQIQLIFEEFDVEASTLCSDAFLQIISGNYGSGTVVGTYCNSAVPPSLLNIMNDTVTIVFYSEDNPGFEGFTINWNCTQQNIAPVADFSFSSLDNCGGIIQFTDQSLHQPMGWIWDFGDGTTSDQQHPIHEYMQNGVYDVQLRVNNTHGTDSILLTSIITVNRPIPANDSLFSICFPQEMKIPSGNGITQFWFADATTSIPFAYDDTVSIFVDNGLTELFCRNYAAGTSHSGGKIDNSGTGGYLNSTTAHYLGFDVMKPITLKAVTVYAQNAGNRTFTLRDANDQIVNSSTHALIIGYNRITLNYIVMPGNNYKLQGPANAYLYRNGDANGTNFPYPYLIEDLVSINRSSAGYPSASKYYYYFYDWEVESICMSAPAVKQIMVSIPDTSITVSPSTSLCLSDSILIYANQSVTWQPSNVTSNFIFVSQPGTYFAEFNAAGCPTSTSNEITITGDQYPNAEFNYSVNGLEVTFSNTSTGDVFHWIFGDGNESWSTDPVYTYSATGTYTVTLYAQNSCGTDSISMTVNVVSTSISQIQNDDLQIYPNPADNNLFYMFPDMLNNEGDVYLSVINSIGQICIYRKIPSHPQHSLLEIDISELTPGMYYIRLNSEHRMCGTRFIKQ